MNITVPSDWWKDLFDEIYLCTDARSVCDPVLTSKEVDLILSLLPVRKDHWILDLCGGHGRHSLELADRGYGRCVVVDYSHTLLCTGRKRSEEKGVTVSFFRADARNGVFRSETFDHVLLLGNSLGYGAKPDADEEILREAFRMLKPGGWILADVTDGRRVRRRFNPNTWHEIGEDMVVCRQRELCDDHVRAREMVLSKKEGLIRDATYAIRLYSPEELANLFSRSGFTDVKVRTDFSNREGKEDLGFMNYRMAAVGRRPA